MTVQRRPGETVREWVERGCTLANPPPCWEGCGIDGLPCPRCQREAFDGLCLHAERDEHERLIREIEGADP